MKSETKTTADVKFTVNIQLTEQEAGALDAIIGYGADAFLKVFYEHMGKSYLQKYESGLRSLCEHRGQLSHELDKISKAKKVLKELNDITPVNI